MTYEERQKAICEQCNEKANCPYIHRKLEYKCQNLSDTMYGWELGYKDAVDKFCEFMQSCEGYVVSGEKCNYDNFMKFMEEQQ